MIVAPTSVSKINGSLAFKLAALWVHIYPTIVANHTPSRVKELTDSFRRGALHSRMVQIIEAQDEGFKPTDLAWVNQEAGASQDGSNPMRVNHDVMMKTMAEQELKTWIMAREIEGQVFNNYNVQAGRQISLVTT